MASTRARSCVWLARSPAWGVAGITLLLPVYFAPWAALPFEPVKVEFFRYATLATALLFVASRTLGHCHGEPISPPNRQLLAAVALVGATQILATIFSIDPSVSLWGTSDKHGTVTVLTSVLFFFLVSSIARRSEARATILKALLAASVPVMVYAAVQLLGFDPLTWETDSISPMVATLGRSNFVGAYLAMVVPFTLAWNFAAAESSGKRYRWAPIALLSLQYLCIFLTQARAAWCAAVIATAVSLYVFRSPEERRRLRVPAVAIVGGGMFLFAAMNVVNVASLRQSEINTMLQNRLGTARSRLAIWQSTWDLSREHWVLGYGPQTFSMVFDSSTVAPEGDVIVDHPHNIVLEYLFATGVLGLGAFVFLLVRFYAQLTRLLQRDESRSTRVFAGALAGSTAAYFVQGQFNPELVVLSVLFWLNLGLAAATIHTV